MRKIAALCGILLASQTSLAHAEKTTISVTYSSGAYSEVLEESARQFEKTNPSLKIVFRKPVVSTYDDLLQATLRSAITNDLPDVSLEGSQNVGILVSHGIPIALDAFIASESDWSSRGYSPSIKDVGEIDGKSYALAYATSVPMIYYNLDLLKKAGVDIDNIRGEWPSITDVSAKVQKLNNGIVGGLFDYNSTGNWTFQALVTSQNASILNQNATGLEFDSPEVLKALQILKEFGDAGTVDMSQQQMLQAFASGTVGVLASYSAALGQIEKQAAGKFTLKAVPWPMISQNGRVPAGGRVIMIYSKDQEKQRAAWEFVKFLTGPIGQTILVKGVGAVPVNDVAVNKPELLGSFYEQNPNQVAALSSASRLTKWLSYPGDNSIKVSEVIRNQIRRVLIGHQDPAVVLADIKAAVRPLVTGN
ncbi:extracellular solute-binding protein [Sinorhizobium meliloti]|uniref:extracellular solute-binding protein n=1 Tax=Rhizobium meliloti TaxID=382 RepID=UPI000FD7B047|nr:extracellular solute-binding protein [Sinorhizobium meliloti]RVE82138.1 extracellular solute-binding protein [Sinorhizobium meliloti]RVH24051.1 extracellular solute-binding protein [Sinorhizobium meliloti]